MWKQWESWRLWVRRRVGRRKDRQEKTSRAESKLSEQSIVRSQADHANYPGQHLRPAVLASHQFVSERCNYYKLLQLSCIISTPEIQIPLESIRIILSDSSPPWCYWPNSHFRPPIARPSSETSPNIDRSKDPKATCYTQTPHREATSRGYIKKLYQETIPISKP